MVRGAWTITYKFVLFQKKCYVHHASRWYILAYILVQFVYYWCHLQYITSKILSLLHACLDVVDDVTALLWMSLVDFVG